MIMEISVCFAWRNGCISLVIADWVDINYVILVYVCHLQPQGFLGPLGSCFGPLGDWVLARNAASEASVRC